MGRVAKGDELRRVGRAVAARRGELGMTQHELAEAAGVDLKTVYNLESGTRWPIARTRAAISAALGWEADALARISDDGDPVLAAYIQGVRHELARAEARYGPGFTAEQAFPVPHEAATWRDEDGRMPDENKRIALIAGIRKLTDEYGSQASNTGLARALISAGHGFP